MRFSRSIGRLRAPANSLQVMAFFSKTLDKLKGALRKTAAVLNTDVRTLFVPGRQINDEFLTEIEEKLLQSDMGVANVDRIVTAIRNRWRLGKIKNAKEAGKVIRDEVLEMLTAPTLSAASAPTGGTPAIATTPVITTPSASEGTGGTSSADDRELHFTPTGPTVILVAGI